MAETAVPKISIYNSDNTSFQDTWNAGELDLSRSDSFESNVLVINVWNNRYGNEDVPDLVGCNITTKNIHGGMTDEQVVTERWVQCCVESTASSPTTFSPIGVDDNGNELVCGIAHQNPSEYDKTNFVIKGTANSGNAGVATDNYSKISLKIVPTINGRLGVHNFKTRISGYYI